MALVILVALAGCGAPGTNTGVVVAFVNRTAKAASAIWTEGSSSPPSSAPYVLAPCTIEHFGFRRGTTTTVAVTDSTGRHDFVVAAPTGPQVRTDVVTISDPGVQHVIDTTEPVLPSPCPG